LLLNKLLLVAFLLLFTGCGYKPSSQYTKQVLDGKTFVEVIVSLEDPKNSVLIKDALNEIVISRLGGHLVHKKDDADVILVASFESIYLDALGYDTQGYVQTYRATVNININYKTKTKNGNTKVSGTYDFSLGQDNTVSDAKRFEAIKIASDKAISDFVSKIAIVSFQ